MAHPDENAVVIKLNEISDRLSRLESLSRGGRASYLGKDRLLVRCDWNEMRTVYIVSASDRLIMPNLVSEGFYEPSVTDFICNNVKQEYHCLDIGANFGYYSCIMAKLAWQGRVIGVEADSQTCELLRDNIYINWVERVCTFRNLAIADKDDYLTLYRRDTRAGNTSIMKPEPSWLREMGEPPAESFTVKSAPIDSFLEQLSGRIDLIKIDIEGAEPLAFQGISETVKLNPCIKFIIEWCPGQITAAGFELREFAKTISDLRLQPWIIENEGVRSISFDDLLSVPYLSGILLATAL